MLDATLTQIEAIKRHWLSRSDLGDADGLEKVARALGLASRQIMEASCMAKHGGIKGPLVADFLLGKPDAWLNVKDNGGPEHECPF